MALELLYIGYGAGRIERYGLNSSHGVEFLYIGYGTRRITQTHLTEKSMNRQQGKICTYVHVYGTSEQIQEINFAEAEKRVAAMIAESADFHEEYLNEGMVDDCSESTSGTQQED